MTIRKVGVSKVVTIPKEWGQLDERVMIEMIDENTLRVRRGSLDE